MNKILYAIDISKTENLSNSLSFLISNGHSILSSSEHGQFYRFEQITKDSIISKGYSHFSTERSNQSGVHYVYAIKNIQPPDQILVSF